MLPEGAGTPRVSRAGGSLSDARTAGLGGNGQSVPGHDPSPSPPASSRSYTMLGEASSRLFRWISATEAPAGAPTPAPAPAPDLVEALFSGPAPTPTAAPDRAATQSTISVTHVDARVRAAGRAADQHMMGSTAAAPNPAGDGPVVDDELGGEAGEPGPDPVGDGPVLSAVLGVEAGAGTVDGPGGRAVPPADGGDGITPAGEVSGPTRKQIRLATGPEQAYVAVDACMTWSLFFFPMDAVIMIMAQRV